MRTGTDSAQVDVAGIAAELTPAQRDYALDRYDDDFVSHGDAIMLERLGIWTLGEADGEYAGSYVTTSLGLAVRAHLAAQVQA